MSTYVSMLKKASHIKFVNMNVKFCQSMYNARTLVQILLIFVVNSLNYYSHCCHVKKLNKSSVIPVLYKECHSKQKDMTSIFLGIYYAILTMQYTQQQQAARNNSISFFHFPSTNTTLHEHSCWNKHFFSKQ